METYRTLIYYFLLIVGLQEGRRSTGLGWLVGRLFYVLAYSISFDD